MNEELACRTCKKPTEYMEMIHCASCYNKMHPNHYRLKEDGSGYDFEKYDYTNYNDTYVMLPNKNGVKGWHRI